MINKGFTIIELITVISIIGIMAGMTVVVFRKQDDAREVDQAARALVDIFKQAQTAALTRAQVAVDGNSAVEAYTVVFGCSTTPCNAQVIPEADIKVFNLSDKPVASFYFPADIVLTSISKDNDDENFVTAFDIPRGDMTILKNDDARSDWTGNEAIVKINKVGSADDAISRCVKINSISGRIDIGQCPEPQG